MGEMVRAIDTKGYNTVLCEITDLRQEDVEAIVDATFSQVGTGKISFIDAVIYIEEILSMLELANSKVNKPVTLALSM